MPTPQCLWLEAANNAVSHCVPMTAVSLAGGCNLRHVCWSEQAVCPAELCAHLRL